MVTAKSLGSTVGNVGLIFVYGLGVGLCWYFGLGTMQSFTRGADHDLDHPPSFLSSIWQLRSVVCGIYTVQILPRKRAVDNVGYTAPTRLHELDHTDKE